MFAKLGLGGRGDMQLESEEFNRRFRVEVADQDQPIVVRLLDAAFQQTMLDRFVGAIPDGFWRAMPPAFDDTRVPAWPDRT